jgi:hypothetical protein
VLEREVAGEYIEKKPIDNLDWDAKTPKGGALEHGSQTGRDSRALERDTKTFVEGALEHSSPTGRDGRLLITGKILSLSVWLVLNEC